MKLWLSRESLTRNMLLVGASGTMKTSLLLSLADQAIAAGKPLHLHRHQGTGRQAFLHIPLLPARERFHLQCC
jgi:septin family protein